MSDKGSINNITLPVSKRLQKDIKDAIQADKDILSQIVYDEPNIILPKNILPLRIKVFNGTNTTSYYFDYINALLIDEHGEQTSVSFDVYDNNIIFIDNSDEDIRTITGLEYILFNGDDFSVLNTYYLYYPQGGTKLYLHKFTFKDTSNNTHVYFAISLYSGVITNANKALTILANNIVGIGFPLPKTFYNICAWSQQDGTVVLGGFTQAGSDNILAIYTMTTYGNSAPAEFAPTIKDVTTWTTLISDEVTPL